MKNLQNLQTLEWQKRGQIIFKAYVWKNWKNDYLYDNSLDGLYLHLVVVQVF